jgi:hypothetical protein
LKKTFFLDSHGCHIITIGVGALIIRLSFLLDMSFTIRLLLVGLVTFLVALVLLIGIVLLLVIIIIIPTLKGTIRIK